MNEKLGFFEPANQTTIKPVLPTDPNEAHVFDEFRDVIDKFQQARRPILGNASKEKIREMLQVKIAVCK